MREPPPLGQHEGVPDEVYHERWDAISRSDLKLCLDSQGLPGSIMPLVKKTVAQPTDAMVFGTLFHMRVLEPDRYAELVHVVPFERRAGKEYAAWVADLPAGSHQVRQVDADRIEAMAQNIERHRYARSLLVDRDGPVETSFVWDDQDTGIRCKARLDRYLHGICAVDLKSALDVSPAAFASAMWKYGYDMQAAHYSDGYTAVTGQRTRFCFVVAAKDPPFEVAVYVPTAGDVQIGRERCRAALRMIQWYRDSGAARRYGADDQGEDVVSAIELPPWAAMRWQSHVDSTGATHDQR